ncbi:LOW QUALITY PROTEIN: hypothetical protein OSB04_023074 [Centaurea solstitialis]|uniref:FAD dependent oxidoreductase domain-containing protein n=1 Tax=Centaurea solstitialis TaxID=347529 RepID=A0AA38VZ88_9ASTR|nr:LOW QUALITY PROTEIN: hypothetical protein OSB04_023074 [Centaurea solstitialis]
MWQSRERNRTENDRSACVFRLRKPSKKHGEFAEIGPVRSDAYPSSESGKNTENLTILRIRTDSTRSHGERDRVPIGETRSKTLLIEQFDFLHYRGSSHGESRTIRATYPEPYYCKMAIESEKLGSKRSRKSVTKCTSDRSNWISNNASLMAVIENCEKQSVNHRILDRYETNEHFSGRIELPEDWIAVVTDLGGVLKPTKSVAMFQTLAIKYGAVLRDKTEIVDVVTDGDDRGGVSVTSRRRGVFGQEMRGDRRSLGRFHHRSGVSVVASYGEPYVYGTPASEFPDLIKVAVHGGRECDPDKRTWGADSEGTVDLIPKCIHGIRGVYGSRWGG